jgi:hypothetical protein
LAFDLSGKIAKAIVTPFEALPEDLANGSDAAPQAWTNQYLRVSGRQWGRIWLKIRLQNAGLANLIAYRKRRVFRA